MRLEIFHRWKIKCEPLIPWLCSILPIAAPNNGWYKTGTGWAGTIVSVILVLFSVQAGCSEPVAMRLEIFHWWKIKCAPLIPRIYSILPSAVPNNGWYETGTGWAGTMFSVFLVLVSVQAGCLEPGSMRLEIFQRWKIKCEPLIPRICSILPSAAPNNGINETGRGWIGTILSVFLVLFSVQAGC